MKAITICQPYAHLICLPEDHARMKRVENRTWPTSYRGPIAIHAGKSRQWLAMDAGKVMDLEYSIPVKAMAFGAIVAVARLVECIEVSSLHDRIRRGMPYPGLTIASMVWLANHEHTEGPYGFVLSEVRPLEKPIPYRGAQGMFDIPESVFVSTPTESTP